MPEAGRRETARLVRLRTLAALILCSCTTPIRSEPHAGLQRLWHDYRAMPDERALVLAGNPDRVWVAGVSGGHESQREAEERALEICVTRRAARRLQAPCRLYASGDTIVWSW